MPNAQRVTIARAAHSVQADNPADFNAAVLAFLVPLIVPLPAMFLGLFTSAIQALIFATLAAYYIGEAVHEEHH